MRVFGTAPAIAPKVSWVCPKCLRSQRLSTVPRASHTTRANKVYAFTGIRRKVLLATAGGMLGAGTILAFSDDIKHGYKAAQRTGRVIATLALCMKEWV